MNNLRGAKIIYQESKATQPSHLYFLQKDANYCEAIVTSESGAKRKLNFNVDLSNYYTKNETYSKIEVDGLFNAIEVTKTELDVLISENKLEPNRLYKITGVESWCFSQHLIKAIYLKAITNNTLESEGFGEFYTPKYNELDDNLGIWKGELFANGMIDSLSYNIGDKAIWGNLFWENISGEIGNNNYVFEGDDYQLNNYLSETDWQLIIPNNDESLYNINFNIIKYDLINDYIYYREDDLGNKYELLYDVLLEIFPTSWIIYSVPEFIYNVNSISLFQWGKSNINNNFINNSIVFNCNYNTPYFKDNIILEKSIIERNNLLGVNFIGNKLTQSFIRSNYIKTFGGIINNILDDSEISSNRYYLEIINNRLSNHSQINSNNDNNIIVNNKYTIIKDNILDNNCKISGNVFVEEGKEVDGTIKSIYGNELINNCSISYNTIKNGSTIFGHKLEYYSTINGNNLDTESNIYNNQVVQNGKIDNNILTGHGRIYGNQLDRLSEITLCKLRISPATSYATTMKNNRLFAGKIQNVDFGNIVNPEGTNPNNPSFGGNELSNSIIENSSIIKDLTFPNHGGVGIQFVKMNGFSELKNITINNSIINVDFINTIFNETSDYYKLIEGSGYKTNGFTKTYIDGVLLQDKFNAETLDVITDRGNTTENDITVGGLTTNYVQLDTTSVNTYNIGKVYWNETKGTYNFGLKNNVELQLGQEQHVYGKAYSAISNGQLVMYRTSQGGHILFEPANFTQLSTNPDLIIGVATQDIALNDFGYITTFGDVNTLNTSSFADGGTLYFGSGNVLQNTAPTGSYFIVGRVNRSHATQGSIFVKPYFVDGNLESKSNKSDSYTASSSTTYASTKALVDGLATKLSKGTYTGTASDLVPYDNANKDVNIASNYFKTSKGFNFTFDAYNYFNTYQSDYYSTLKFKSKDSSDDNFGYLQITANAEEGFNVDCVDGNGATANSLQVSINGISSPKAFVSGGGFKTPFGTPNQALTADGGVFDLNTKSDLVGGKVPSSQLPSYVDDVLEYANLASFPATGESGKIYIAIDTNLTYRWTGTGYAEISASLALGETSSTAYRGDRGKIAYDHSQTTGNPHGTTKADIGLGNVDNTSDLDKPISTATQNALNGKQNVLTNPITGTVTANYIPKSTGGGTVVNSIIYDNGTNIGIGTNAPNSTDSVHVFSSTSKSSIRLQSTHSTSSAEINFQSAGGSGKFELDYAGNMVFRTSQSGLFFDNFSTTGSIYFRTGGSNERMRIDNNGNIGIGTTSPNRLLHVNGIARAITFTADRFAQDGLQGSSYFAPGTTSTLSSQGNLTIQTVNSNTDILITPTRNVGIGTTSPSEKLEVSGSVKATGFKTPTGTATQSLTADGGTFDLNLKADLVDGKVPSSQLPSYVDDVLEFANLASFPTTGESGKIYIAIDTNVTYRWTGSNYVEISASLALGETSSTAYRGDRGKTAYDHSQATGNPHNTKVEELNDVGSDTTSIVDTDAILKKEVGGLWKKITWSNIKANLKTYFDSIYTTSSAVDSQITTAINSNKKSFTYDILVVNWSLVSGKYEAVISNAGILSNSFVDVIPSNDHIDIVRNAQIYPSVLISEGSVKVYSKFLPSDTISVTVNII